jgi:hypothetical protein
MKISINCPSYKRPKVETLDYIPSCKVWVDNKEYKEYIKENKGFENNIISVPDGIQGNLCRIRNYILDNELKDNDVVLIIDDDMQGIYRYEQNGDYGYEKYKLDEKQLYLMLEHYSVLCEDFGFKYWGVNCNADALSYRHTTPFSTVSYIGGPFQVFLKGNNLRYDEKLMLKEDYDMTIQNCNKYRGCLRVNKYHYNCKQSKQKGGCATYRNYDREAEQLKLLQQKWGKDIVKIDEALNVNTKKEKVNIDYNPIIKIPIKGV